MGALHFGGDPRQSSLERASQLLTALITGHRQRPHRPILSVAPDCARRRRHESAYSAVTGSALKREELSGRRAAARWRIRRNSLRHADLGTRNRYPPTFFRPRRRDQRALPVSHSDALLTPRPVPGWF
ncbi:hypothetical protein GCM10022236_52900 [Microlunatus ginsengisoli]|uniref:Uncharacterized protein n=1 Tax=Microlunatus ginsengisoli TaxID=363863 RepID=A0ABP7AZ67_9ACTN